MRNRSSARLRARALGETASNISGGQHKALAFKTLINHGRDANVLTRPAHMDAINSCKP